MVDVPIASATELVALLNANVITKTEAREKLGLGELVKTVKEDSSLSEIELEK